MKYNELFLNKIVNKSLLKFGVKIEDLLKEAGEAKERKDKKYIPYYEKYSFENEDEYGEWKEWTKEFIRKGYPKFNDKELEFQFRWIDALCGISQKYLFEPFKNQDVCVKSEV